MVEKYLDFGVEVNFMALLLEKSRKPVFFAFEVFNPAWLLDSDSKMIHCFEGCELSLFQTLLGT